MDNTSKRKRKKTSEPLQSSSVVGCSNQMRTEDASRNAPVVAAVPRNEVNVFEEARHSWMYVDKTEFIRAFWEDKEQVCIIQRPSYFGKSLAAAMVEMYFQIGKACAESFRNTSIFNPPITPSPAFTRPVIHLSFAGIHVDTAAFIRDTLLTTAREAYPDISLSESNNAENIFKELLCSLYNKYQVKVIVIIDEYDTPLNRILKSYFGADARSQLALKASALAYYQFLSVVLNRKWVERALFFCNIYVDYNVLFDDRRNLFLYVSKFANPGKYLHFFGYTQGDVDNLCDASTHSINEDTKQKMKSWYSIPGPYGDIYCPKSINNFLQKQLEFDMYRVHGGGSSFLPPFLKVDEILAEIRDIRFAIPNRPVQTTVALTPHVIGRSGKLAFPDIVGILVQNGILTCADLLSDATETYMLVIANKESAMMLQRKVEASTTLSKFYECGYKKTIVDALDQCNWLELREPLLAYFKCLGSTANWYETSFHAIMNTLLHECAHCDNSTASKRYAVQMEGRAGTGYFDNIFVPTNPNERYGTIFEFAVASRRESVPTRMSEKLRQVKSKSYVDFMKCFPHVQNIHVVIIVFLTSSYDLSISSYMYRPAFPNDGLVFQGSVDIDDEDDS